MEILKHHGAINSCFKPTVSHAFFVNSGFFSWKQNKPFGGVKVQYFSLITNSKFSPEKSANGSPIGKDRIPTIHFQVANLLASFQGGYFSLITYSQQKFPREGWPRWLLFVKFLPFVPCEFLSCWLSFCTEHNTFEMIAMFIEKWKTCVWMVC